MYCRIYNHETNRYYRSVVYGKINAGCFEDCIVLNPQHSRFELVAYFSRADTSTTPQIWTIQPETDGWVRLSGAQLLPFAQYLKKHDIAYRLDLFPFLPIRLQFWQADEEFPASFQLHWDMNTLDFVHYETTYYIAGHLYSRLRELMEQP